jgi:hypothetical protein
MRRSFALLNLHCRLATRLISDAHERPLSRLERVGLCIHLLGCRPCRRYRRQLRMLDRLVQAVCAELPAPAQLPDAARQRIQRQLSRFRDG